jgi:hypothetical protein
VLYLVATVAFGVVYAFDRQTGWFPLYPSRVLAHAHLGLVDDVRVHGDEVEIDMTLTTPGCPVSERLPAEAEMAVRAGFPALASPWTWCGIRRGPPSGCRPSRSSVSASPVGGR